MSSDESDIEYRIGNLNLDDNNAYINILLLGETGVGKSTFINALGNYFSLKYFDIAEKNEVVVVIPTIYEITDKNNKTRKIELGKKIEDNNECQDVGESATQGVRTYIFPLWKGRIKVRLIDTPGIGDTRGIEQDETNCGKILNYLKTLEKIHAICFLLKPTQARETTFFKYCLHQSLSIFDKAACKNIFFLYTNTRGSDYTPGETVRTLEKVLQPIEKKSQDIKISTDTNYYCFDNEAFKYLAAVEKHVIFDKYLREVNLNSWRISAKNAHSLITQLQRGSPPAYSTDNLMKVQSARRMVFFFSKLLSRISETMKDNSNVLNRLNANRNDEIAQIERLRKDTITIKDVVKTKVCQPVTVCTDKKCADVYWVNGEPKWHYKKVCHGTCIEVCNARLGIVGCPDLLNCHVISETTRKCLQCDCDYLTHMQVDYISRIEEIHVLDDKKRNIIAGKQDVLDNSKEIIEDVEMKIVELRNEYDAIQTFAGGIARFLHENAIVSFSSSMKEYVVYLIEQKMSLGDSAEIKSSIEEMRNLQKQIDEIEEIFEKALGIPEKNIVTDILDFKEHSKKLSTLIHNSQEIKQFFNSEMNFHMNPSSVKDYVHEKYYEGEDYGRSGAKNKNRSDQRRDFKENIDERHGNSSGKYNVNEERNRREKDSRNRNERSSNRDQKNPPKKPTVKVTLNVDTANQQPHTPPYHPPPQQGYPPYYPPQGYSPPQGYPPHHPQQGYPPPQGYPTHHPHQGYPPPQGYPTHHPHQGYSPYHPPHYPQPKPYQRPETSGRSAGSANCRAPDQQSRRNDRGRDHHQKAYQNRRGASDRRGDADRGQGSRSRYRRFDHQKKGSRLDDESDASSKY